MTITRAQIESCLTSRNVKAAIRLIRRGESWNDRDHPGSEYDERAYRVRYGGWANGNFRAPEFFDSFDDHPRIYEPLPDGRKSSAAGMAQFTATRFDDLRARYPGVLTGKFTPHEQECCTVLSMYDRGALDFVIDGNIAAFLPLLAKEWASLPSSPLDDGGKKMSLATAYDEWHFWGGDTPVVIDRATDDRDDAPASIEDRSRQASPEDVERITGTSTGPGKIAPPASSMREEPMTPALFVLPLLQSLFEAFSPVLRAKVTKALDKQVGDPAVSGQVADALMGIVKGVAGGAGVPIGTPGATAQPAGAAADPVIAVAAVKSNPALLAQAEAEIDAYIDQISPVLAQLDQYERGAWAASEESAKLASERAQSEPDGGNDALLTWAILLIAGTTLLALGVALAVLIYADRPYGEVLALFAAGVGSVWAKFSTRYDYRYGSSRSSQAKDFAINQLSRR